MLTTNGNEQKSNHGLTQINTNNKKSQWQKKEIKNPVNPVKEEEKIITSYFCM